jgi:hypothetical protein
VVIFEPATVMVPPTVVNDDKHDTSTNCDVDVIDNDPCIVVNDVKEHVVKAPENVNELLHQAK